MAPIKEQSATPEGAPDVRPIGISECFLRAIHSSIVTQYKNTFAEHFWPQQVAVGIPGGLSLHIQGIQLTLELHPDWVVAKLDLRNAYNEVKRRTVIDRLHDAEALRDLVPLAWATSRVAPEVYFAQNGAQPAGYRSEEGVS